MAAKHIDVHGYAVLSAATSAEISLFDYEGNAITVESSDVVTIYDWQVAETTGTTTETMKLISDNDDDNATDTGETLCVVTVVSGNPTYSFTFPKGKKCAPGAKPHFISSTSAIAECTLSGRIERGT